MEPIEWIMLVVAIGSAVASAYSQSKNRSTQIDENQKDRDFTQMMWDEEHDYVGLMDSLTDAGFNPHMAAQSLLGGSIGSGSAVNMTSSQLPAMDLGNSMSDIFSGVMQAGVNNSEMANMDADTILKQLEADIKPMKDAAQIELWNDESYKLVKDGMLSEEQRKMVLDERLQFEMLAPYKRMEQEKILAQMDQDLLNSKQQFNNLVAQEAETLSQVGLNVSSTAVNYSEIPLNQAKTNEANANAFASNAYGTYISGLHALNEPQIEFITNIAAKYKANGCYFSEDFLQAYSYAKLSDDENAIEFMKNVQDGIFEVANAEYDNEIMEAYKNRWKSSGINFAENLSDLPKELLYMLPFYGMFKGKSAPIGYNKPKKRY